MSQVTFLIGYGNEKSEGRGIYQVNAGSKHISASLVFACQEKPGGLVQQNGQLFLSFQGNNEAGIYRFDLSKSDPFNEPERSILPFFITAWANGPSPDTLLGSSFYDGVDVLLNIASVPVVAQSITHDYRQRSADKRQNSPHPHHICLLPGDLFACSVDMGVDTVSLLAVTPDSLKMLDTTLIDAPVGDGPRILRLRSDGKFAYLLNEISNSLCVFAIEYDEPNGKPAFRELQRLRVVQETTVSYSPAACCLTEDERHLIVSNRGENSLVLFSIDPVSGLLTERHQIATASIPRDITISGTAIFVAAQSANRIQLFSLDPMQHRLHLCGEVNGVESPVAFIIKNS